ncbi:MAG: tol-pal system protein YbgF [candidate division NC10 bacterium]|nr:tol-pal system protein YbgF [candidate division NC10 bacterium]
MRVIVHRLVLLLALSLVLSACTTFPMGTQRVGRGAETISYAQGELRQTYPASMERVWDAALAALRDMQFTIKGTRKDATGGLIEATRADGMPVRVAVAMAGADRTMLAIRVGALGNKETSQFINARIAEAMSRGAQAEAPEVRLGQLVAEIKTSQGELQGTMAKMKEELQALSQSQSLLNTKFDELMAELRIVQGRVEELGYTTSELGQRVDEVDHKASVFAGNAETMMGRLQTLEGQVKTLDAQRMARPAPSQAGEPPPAPPARTPSPPVETLPQPPSSSMAAAPPALSQSPSSPSTPPQAPLPPAPAASPPSRPPAPMLPSPEELYKASLQAYNHGNYQEAAKGFQSYIERYPKESLISNAHFWLGECYYRQNDYVKAIQHFDIVLKDYPDSNKVPGALLKRGYAFLELGREDAGKTILQELIKRYPATREADIARSRLAKFR